MDTMGPVRHLPTVLVVAMALGPLAGCIADPPDAVASPCTNGNVKPGSLQVHVVPSAQHLEHGDWTAATDKLATITPFVDNGTDRYTEDQERLPALSGSLDDDDCVWFQGIEPGWWEIRATARAEETGCSWYGGSGKMVLVEDDAPTTTRFQPTLAYH